MFFRSLLLSFFFVICFSFLSCRDANNQPANIVGEWNLSGAGCRDGTLSESSHVTKPISQIIPDLKNLVWSFKSNKTYTMRALCLLMMQRKI